MPWEHSFETKFCMLSNGEKYGYRECGKGDIPLVLCHGNISSSLTWETTMKKLENRMRVIAPCFRGFGYSTYKTPINSFWDLAEDVVKFLKEVIKVDKFYVMGHSSGCIIAMQIAYLMPDNAAKLLLMSPIDV